MQRNKTQKKWKNEKSTFHFSINQKNAPKYLIRLIESLNRYGNIAVITLTDWRSWLRTAKTQKKLVEKNALFVQGHCASCVHGCANIFWYVCSIWIDLHIYVFLWGVFQCRSWFRTILKIWIFQKVVFFVFEIFYLCSAWSSCRRHHFFGD